MRDSIIPRNITEMRIIAIIVCSKTSENDSARKKRQVYASCITL